MRRAVLRRRGSRKVPSRLPAPADRPVWPIDAPGMPPVIGWLRTLAMEAIRSGTEEERLTEVMRECLYSAGDFTFRYDLKGHRTESWRCVSGHLWEPVHNRDFGPRPAKVMVLGKMLGEEEYTYRRNFIGPSGRLLLDACRQLGIRDINDWYITNLIKTPHPEGFGNSRLRMPWIKEWLSVLHQELRIVRPDFILCVGADASKALLGRQATIKHMEGRLVEYEIPRARHAQDSRPPHTALVMAITHPAQVLATPEILEKFKNQLARFGQLTHGERWDVEEKGLDHRVVRDLAGVRDLVEEIEATIEANLLAFDAEWHGQHPQNSGSYLRTIQLSWKPKTAAAIVLYDEEGQPLYDEHEFEELRELLNGLVADKRLAAHFGDADLEWLEYFGFHWQQYYHAIPESWEEYMERWLRQEPAGFDTGLAAHAILETDDFSLTSQALQHTSAPRYDMRLLSWKRDYCRDHGLKDEELEGFGPCPDDILLGEPDPDNPGHHKHSYACYDADVVWRLVRKQERLLLCDGYGNNCWEPFWIGMRAQPAVLEINCTGVMVDKDRVDKLTEIYMAARESLKNKIRQWARWPEFNLNSVYQIREFLFGEALNGKERPSPDSPPVRLRPPGARSLRLTPIITTDKRPMPWSEVVANGLESEKTPSTNKTALEILGQEAMTVRRRVRGVIREFDFSQQVTWIRDYRFITRVLQASLRPPLLDEDEDAETYLRGEDGHYLYSGGLAAAICDDGRVRTHIYPTKETGRWSSARPPLQNMTKRREVDYKRILGDRYRWPLRTILCASPGHLLVEADYVGAELFGMAILSGDETMIRHALRNQLPEDHPDYYDIHSNIAVLSFGLDCEPTKEGLDRVGKKHLRICAKAVIFGIAYGRGAKAIALQCREEKVPISVEEAQNIINTVFDTYPRLVPFFEACRARVVRERFLVGPFGRYRRFPAAFDQKTLGDFERQAMNFPIQGVIADAVSRAVDHLYHYRENFSEEELNYKIVLQVHDAVLLEVPYRHVNRVVSEVLPHCMVESVPIYPTDLDGMLTRDMPYRLGIDIDVYRHWGEPLSKQELEKLGIRSVKAA